MTTYSARSVYAALFFVFLAGLSLGLWGRLVWRQDQAIVRAAAPECPEMPPYEQPVTIEIGKYLRLGDGHCWSYAEQYARLYGREIFEARRDGGFYMLRVPGDCTGKPCTMSWYTNGGRALSPEYRWSAPVVRVPSSMLETP